MTRAVSRDRLCSNRCAFAKKTKPHHPRGLGPTERFGRSTGLPHDNRAIGGGVERVAVRAAFQEAQPGPQASLDGSGFPPGRKPMPRSPPAERDTGLFRFSRREKSPIATEDHRCRGPASGGSKRLICGPLWVSIHTVIVGYPLTGTAGLWGSASLGSTQLPGRKTL